jgi:hypothetical protein
MASSSGQPGNASRYMTRRLSNESCDLYADVERSFHLRTMAESSPVASCKHSSRNSSRDRGARHSPRRTRIGLEPVQNLSEGEISPSVKLDGTRKSDPNISECTKLAEFDYEVRSDVNPDTPQARTRPPLYSPSSPRQGMSRKSDMADNSTERSYTRSTSPKFSPIAKAETTEVQVVSERPERSQRSKSRERYASERSDRSQEMSISRKSTSRSDQTTDESHERRRSSSRSHRETRQHSQRVMHQRSHAKSLSPNPSQKSSTQPDTSRSVDRKHRNHTSRQATSQRMSKGSGSRSAPDLRLSEKHRKSDGKRSKRKGEKPSKETKDRREVAEKPALTTRTWRAKLAERFGRTPLTTPIIGKNHRLCDRVPALLICSDDFAKDINDDLTAIP